MPSSIVPYCNKLHLLSPFSDETQALTWLQQNKLDNNGITLLVPFLDEFGDIHFLKPTNETNDTRNHTIRILGSANEWKLGLREKLLDTSSDAIHHRDHVPSITSLDGSNITMPTPHGISIVYAASSDANACEVGQHIYKIYNELNAQLANTVKRSTSNNLDQNINVEQLMEGLSLLTVINRHIRSGSIYFVQNDSPNKKLYRYIFAQDATNKTEMAFLAAEKTTTVEGTPMAISTKARTTKSMNHHYGDNFMEYVKACVLSIAIALFMSIILFIALSMVMPLPVAVLMTGIVGAFIFGIVCAIKFAHVIKIKDTIDYGDTTFKPSLNHTDNDCFKTLKSHLTHCLQDRATMLPEEIEETQTAARTVGDTKHTATAAQSTSLTESLSSPAVQKSTIFSRLFNFFSTQNNAALRSKSEKFVETAGDKWQQSLRSH